MIAGMVVFVALAGCGESVEGFRHKGAKRAECFAQDLGRIENAQDLRQSENRIKKHFNALVDLMIAARQWQAKRGCEDVPVPEMCASYRHLQQELTRISLMEGGKEFLQRAQQEALIRLDRYERRIEKRKQG